jgi:hypothetical protein
VGDVLDVGGTRQQITKRPIYRAAGFVEKLRALDPNSVLEQFGFVSPIGAVVLFFGDHDGEFIGFTMTDRSDGSRLAFQGHARRIASSKRRNSMMARSSWAMKDGGRR